MTDDELDAIVNRWAATAKQWRQLKFDEAHADMLALLAEVRTLQPENAALKQELRYEQMKTQNMGAKMLQDMEKLLHRYDDEWRAQK